MDNNRLKKGEYIDSEGKVRRRSERYYKRLRQMRIRYGIAGSAFVIALVLIICIVTGQGRKAEARDVVEEPEMAATKLVMAVEPTATPTPVPEPEINKYEHPDMFYEGYEVFKDSETKEILNQEVISSYGVLIDLKDGHVVAERNAFERMYPASMTKVLTILVAAEHMEDPDDTFTMTQEITDMYFLTDVRRLDIWSVRP